MSDSIKNNGPFDNKNKEYNNLSNNDINKMFQSMEEYNRYSPEDLAQKEKNNDIFKRPVESKKTFENQNKSKSENEQVPILSPESKNADAAPTVMFNRNDFMKQNQTPRNFDTKEVGVNKANGTSSIDTPNKRRRRGIYIPKYNSSDSHAQVVNQSNKDFNNIDINKAKVNRNNNIRDISIKKNNNLPPIDRENKSLNISKILKYLLIVFVLVIICLFSVLKFAQFSDDSFMGNLKNNIESLLPGANKVKVENFSANTETSGYVGDMFTFSLTSSKNVKNVRLVDVYDNILNTTVHNTENDQVIIWTIDYKANSNYKGNIWPQLLTKSGEWVSMKDDLINLNIENLPEQENSEFDENTEANNTPEIIEDDEYADDDNEAISTNDEFERVPVASETSAPTSIPTELITSTPIVTSTPEPTVTATLTPEPTVEPTATPLPTSSAVPVGAAVPASGLSADEMKIATNVYSGKKKVSNFSRTSEINMPDDDYYRLWKEGIFTFRGGPYHQNASQGSPINGVNENILKIAWSYPVGSMQLKSGTVSGFGYMSQPAIIKWYKEAREFMNFNSDKKDVKGLTEVIYACQDGKIYFLDLADGQATRDPIKLGFPMNSAVSVYPSSVPVFAVGQSASFLKTKQVESGFRIFSLLDQKQIYMINGKDRNSYFSNSTFDGTALFDRFSDSMVVAGENGVLYTVMLNSDFKHSVPSLNISPTIVKMNSIQKGQAKKSVGKESSVSMLGKYAYLADSSGLLQCVDTSTMSVVWASKFEDNIDATLAIDVVDGNNAFIYFGNTIQNRTKANEIQIYKINAYTGETVWKKSFNATYDKKSIVGALASPVIGKGIIEDIVIFTVADSSSSAYTIALSKLDGEQLWKKRLGNHSVSSPIAIYDNDNAFVVQGDSSGNLYLLDAKNGEELHCLTLDGAIESSPSAYNGNIVVGTTGGKDKSNIYCITIN